MYCLFYLLVLKLAGLDEDQANLRGIEHVRFESLDGMKASIGLDKAASPYGDCIIAIEMNGEPIVPDHGYPVRAIVPGYCAVRNVKWVSSIGIKVSYYYFITIFSSLSHLIQLTNTHS